MEVQKIQQKILEAVLCIKRANCENGSEINTTDVLLQQILNSSNALLAESNIDFELITVKDELGVVFQMVFEKDEETGVVTTSYINADGTAGVPTGTVTFVNSLTVPVAVTDYVEVSTVDVNAWNAATDFTSDVISFVGRDKTLPFSFQVVDYAITPGTPTLTLEVSLDGVAFTRYNASASLIDITNANSGRYHFTDISAFEYARFVYVSGGSTGSFSLLINK